MPQAKKRYTKGSLSREDDCTLPVYLYLLVYGRRQWVDRQRRGEWEGGEHLHEPPVSENLAHSHQHHWEVDQVRELR